MRNSPAPRSRRQHRSLVESLEHRQLLSASVTESASNAFVLDATSHVLTVTGTEGNDKISLKLKGGRLLAKVGRESARFIYANVQSVAINAGAGNDIVTVASNLAIPVTIDGGEGDDKLSGGGGSTVLIGGAGNNILRGGTGANAFATGGGADAIISFREGVDGGQDDSNGQAGKAGKGGKFFGSVAAVDTTAGTLTLNTFSHNSAVKQKTFNVPASTAVTVDGQPAALADLATLAAGARVTVQVDKADPTTAISAAAVGAHLRGEVAAVDSGAGTITLKGVAGAADQTYTVGVSAAVTLDGAASTLAAITIGNRAELWLSAVDATTAVAVEARTTAARPDDHGGGGHHDGGAAVGSVVSVDETAGTVTLSSSHARAPRNSSSR